MIILNAFTSAYLTFAPYVSMFEADLKKYSKQEEPFRILVIAFADDVKSAIGPNGLAYCQPETGFIGVDKERWETLTRTQRKMLIYHELGHCALGLGHVSNKKRLMAPSLLIESEFRMHTDRILTDFFNSSKIERSAP